MSARPNSVSSPDGSLLVEFEENEYKMSHWVRSPRIIDVKSQQILVDLWGGTLWDGTVNFGREGEVILARKRYPSDLPGFTVLLDPLTRTFVFEDLPEKREPLSKFLRTLDRRHTTRAGRDSMLRRLIDYLKP